MKNIIKCCINNYYEKKNIYKENEYNIIFKPFLDLFIINL